MPRGGSRRSSLQIGSGAVLILILGLGAPSGALAQDAKVKLALSPVDQPGRFFDLSMTPGETRTLQVDIGNDGDTAIAARTYAADVYTIIDGGFGARLRAGPQTGTTGWLVYPTDVLQLEPGEHVRRVFTVTVPLSAVPGDYITSLILENDQSIRDAAAIGLDQILRQAVAVVVTVPGRRSPGLAIGSADHEVVAATSIVRVAVENTGNVRLKPNVGFTLVDPSGIEISHTTIQMDTFYARTSTFVEFPLAGLLAPGTYAVHLTLDAAADGAHADKAAIPLVVEARPAPDAPTGLVPGLIDVFQGRGGSPTILGLLIVAGLLFGSWLVWFIRRRRHQPVV